MEKNLCKSEGLPLQFIMQKKTNDDDDDWDDEDDPEESFNDALISFIHPFFQKYPGIPEHIVDLCKSIAFEKKI